MKMLRECIGLDQIAQEIEVNKRAGFKHIGLVTEDGFLYGAKGVRVNKEALQKLLKTIREHGVTADFTHVSISSVLQAPDMVEAWAAFCGHCEEKPYFVQIGLETGSPRILKMYMAGKPAPWKPDDWPWMAMEATSIMNEYGWYPCYTLILGLPGETEDDAKATLELVRKMRGMRCWIFPLLFVPMGGSMLQDKDFAPAKLFEQDVYRDILYETPEQNLEFTKRILESFLSRVRNKFVKLAVKKFMETGLATFEKLKDDVKRRFPELLQQAAKVDLNSPLTLTRLLIHAVFSKFR